MGKTYICNNYSKPMVRGGEKKLKNRNSKPLTKIGKRAIMELSLNKRKEIK